MSRRKEVKAGTLQTQREFLHREENRVFRTRAQRSTLMGNGCTVWVRTMWFYLVEDGGSWFCARVENNFAQSCQDYHLLAALWLLVLFSGAFL